MITPGAGTVIGAGLGFAGGLLQNRSQKKQFKESMAFARDQFEYSKMQDQRNYEASKMTSRVQDMKDAGLHPTLLAGGAGSGQPGAQAAAGSAPGGLSREQGVLESALAGAQIGLVRNEANRVAAEQRNIDADTALKSQEHGADLPNMTAQQMQQALDNNEVNRQQVLAHIKKLEQEVGDMTRRGANEDTILEQQVKIQTSQAAIIAHDLERLLSSEMHSSQLSSEFGQIRSLINEITSNPEKLTELLGGITSSVYNALETGVQHVVDSAKNKINPFKRGSNTRSTLR